MEYTNIALIVSPVAKRGMDRVPKMPPMIDVSLTKFVYNKNMGLYYYDPKRDPEDWYKEYESIRPGYPIDDGFVIVSVMLLNLQGKAVFTKSVRS